jgi:hypothetical protein
MVQLIVMLICVGFFSAIAAFTATILGAWNFPEVPWWYSALLAPGLLPFKLFSRHGHASWLGNGESWLAFAVTFLYYFGLAFAFVYWIDRR